MKIVEPEEVLDFWIVSGPSKWWKKDEEFDRDIKNKFKITCDAAATNALGHWKQKPDDTLALILVLDQFSRNLYRDDPRAFSQDPSCLIIAKDAIKNGADKAMREDIRAFCYLPLMHSENLEDQKVCLLKMQELNEEEYVKAAQTHLDIIEEFGRFPHRNKVLNRPTTAKEHAFLNAGGFSG